MCQIKADLYIKFCQNPLGILRHLRKRRRMEDIPMKNCQNKRTNQWNGVVFQTNRLTLLQKARRMSKTVNDIVCRAGANSRKDISLIIGQILRTAYFQARKFSQDVRFQFFAKCRFSSSFNSSLFLIKTVELNHQTNLAVDIALRASLCYRGLPNAIII